MQERKIHIVFVGAVVLLFMLIQPIANAGTVLFRDDFSGTALDTNMG